MTPGKKRSEKEERKEERICNRTLCFKKSRGDDELSGQTQSRSRRRAVVKKKDKPPCARGAKGMRASNNGLADYEETQVGVFLDESAGQGVGKPRELKELEIEQGLCGYFLAVQRGNHCWRGRAIHGRSRKIVGGIP